jgi:hypothetical protein
VFVQNMPLSSLLGYDHTGETHQPFSSAGKSSSETLSLVPAPEPEPEPEPAAAVVQEGEGGSGGGGEDQPPLPSPSKATLPLKNGVYKNVPVGRMLAGEVVTPLAPLTNQEQMRVAPQPRTTTAAKSTAQAAVTAETIDLAAAEDEDELSMHLPDDLLAEQQYRETARRAEKVRSHTMTHNDTR